MIIRGMSLPLPLVIVCIIIILALIIFPLIISYEAEKKQNLSKWEKIKKFDKKINKKKKKNK